MRKLLISGLALALGMIAFAASDANASPIDFSSAMVSAGATTTEENQSTGQPEDPSNTNESLCYPTGSGSCQSSTMPSLTASASEKLEASAAAKTTGGADPTVSTSGAITPSDPYLISANTSASASLTYYVEVTGPSASVLVDVSAPYAATCSVSSVFSSYCSAAEFASPLGGFSVQDAATPFGSGGQSIGITSGQAMGVFAASAELAIGQQYAVTMSAQSEATCGGDDFGVLIYCGSFTGGGTSASIDPLFTIDPSVSDANAYSILISPDLLSTTTTPLPATLPLFASGLGPLALFGWRRKRKAKRVSI